MGIITAMVSFAQRSRKSAVYATALDILPVCRGNKSLNSVVETEKKKLGYIYVRRVGKSRSDLIDVSVSIEADPGRRIGWLPDTGSDVEAICLRDLDKLDPYLSHNLAVDSDEVYAANGEDLDSLGKLKAVLKAGEHRILEDKKTTTPVDHQKVSQAREEILADMRDAMQGEELRQMEGPEVHIELVDEAIPCKRYKPYAIPFHWKEKVERQLDDLTKQGE